MKRKLLSVFIILIYIVFAMVCTSSNGINANYTAFAVEDDEKKAEKKQPELPDTPEIELGKEYKIIEKYQTEWPNIISFNIQYDKYSVFPEYVVNISTYKRKIYSEPNTKSDVYDKITYGEKFQAAALVEDENEDRWYALVLEYKEEIVIGYVQETKVEKREFQLEDMKKYLLEVENFHNLGHIVYLENYRYANGFPPVMPNGSYYDDYGYRRGQSIAGYYDSTMDGKFRYIPDGMLGIVEEVIEVTEAQDDVIVIDSKGRFADKNDYSKYFDEEDIYKGAEGEENDAVSVYNENTEVAAVKLYIPTFDESLWVEQKYISEDKDSPDVLDQVIMVDRFNQTIVVLEHHDEWEIISLNYSSTGKVGQYSLPTPLGYYMAIAKKIKFDYVKDGTSQIVGFAPFAIRFSGGGYLHGVPVSYYFDDQGQKHSPGYYVEYLASIGTIPKSHMCVRNYTSHAEFMYEWVDIGNCAIIVIE